MEKELVELYESAKKAADASTDADSPHEESRCLDALEQLKKFPVNYQILVNTQLRGGGGEDDNEDDYRCMRYDLIRLNVHVPLHRTREGSRF